MSQRATVARALGAVIVLGVGRSGLGQAQAGWKQHDVHRPRPPVVTPAPPSSPVSPPPDAIVLFDGSGLSAWEALDGTPTRWVVEDGAMISVAGAGYVRTKQAFGDAQVHVEWATPARVEGSGQGRGNSGVFLMGRYEIQVLDSYRNDTYPDGQAGAVYGQHPPLANASRPPGEWQTYDLFFRRPRFGASGALLEPARVTVLHNGILIQNNAVIWGPTSWLRRDAYTPHPDALPLALQDHGNPVRFRNIWIRPLTDPSSAAPEARAAVAMTREQLDRYVGPYAGDAVSWTVTRDGDRLQLRLGQGPPADLVPHSPTEFSLQFTDAALVFDLDGNGAVVGATFRGAEAEWRARKTR